MVKIGNDWFVKVKCPRPNDKIRTPEEHIKACSGCPYVIWEKPQSVAGFMNSMCGVRVGSIGMAAELDTIAENLLGLDRFTKTEGSATLKLGMLMQIKSHARNTGWRIEGNSREETLKHLDHLMEFCRWAEAKGLSIRAWA